MTTLVTVLLALCVGLLVGGVAVRTMMQRTTTRATVVSEGAVDDAARAEFVLDGMSTGIVIADVDGAVVYRNTAARAFAGTHAGVLIDETVERHLRSARTDEMTEELLDLYGPPKLVLVIRSARMPGGGSYAFVEDISERRRIDSVRTDFVANISHELKTPVGALAVLAETLVDETDPATVKRVSERLLDESHRAARTIDDLLELSRIELGDEQMRDGVGVADVIRCAVERGEALAEQRGIRITTLDSTTGPLSVTGDRRQLISAVGNLVENAVKYSEPSGQVQIRARTEGPWVEFMVADQGVGIPSRDLDRIFERFYRVDKARSRGTGGSGLGLSIVRHVATNHGGEVLVSSSEGEGSTFVLRIPRSTSSPTTGGHARADTAIHRDADAASPGRSSRATGPTPGGLPDTRPGTSPGTTPGTTPDTTPQRGTP